MDGGGVADHLEAAPALDPGRKVIQACDRPAQIGMQLGRPMGNLGPDIGSPRVH